MFQTAHLLVLYFDLLVIVHYFLLVLAQIYIAAVGFHINILHTNIYNQVANKMLNLPVKSLIIYNYTKYIYDRIIKTSTFNVDKSMCVYFHTVMLLGM